VESGHQAPQNIYRPAPTLQWFGWLGLRRIDHRYCARTADSAAAAAAAAVLVVSGALPSSHSSIPISCTFVVGG